MKKAKSLLSLILALALVTASLPMMFITAIAEEGAPATPTTVYVDTTNTNETPDGTEANPFTTIAAAVAALNGEDGKVVILNEYDGTAYDADKAANIPTFDVTESHEGTVTYTGAMQLTEAKIKGHTVFEDVIFVSSATYNLTFRVLSYNFTLKGNTVIANAAATPGALIRMQSREDSTDKEGGVDLNIEETVTVTLSGTGLDNVNYAFARMEQNIEVFKNHNVLVVDANIGTVYLGVAYGTGSHRTEMPMASIVLNSGSIKTINTSNKYLNGGTYSIIDTLNIIANNGSTIVARTRSHNGNTKTDTTAKSGGNFMQVKNQFDIKAAKDDSGAYLVPTDTKGQFRVVGDKVAVATNSTGTVRSEDGILTLTQNYTGYADLTDDETANPTHNYDTWNITWEEPPAPPTADFKVGLKENTITVEKTDEFTVDLKVNANKAEILNYASGEITLTYDTTYLTYKGIENGSSVNGASIVVDDSTAGTLKIGFHGANRSFTEVLATLTFEAKTVETALDTPALITITEAGISTAENAAINDLEESDIVEGQTEVTITKQTFTVSGADEKFNMNPENGLVTEGGSITLTPKNPSYIYEITANGEEVTANPDGSFTISDINEDVTIVVVSETAKTFNVTVNAGDLVLDTDYKDTASTATYLTNYVFKVKADKAADQTAGWTYNVTVTDGLTLTKGEEVDGFVTYTVSGETITKDFTITITKTDLEADQFAVNVNNNAVVADKPVVDLNGSVTLTLTQKPGYSYTVKYTMGDGEEVVITTEILAGAYTIENVNGVINVTVTETMNKALTKSVYVESLNIWLVLNTAPKMDGNNTFAFNGVNMYWSSKYNAYAVVVFGEEPDLDTATLTVVTVAAETVIEIAYDKDVNCTGKNDVNDAQLVYNIYNGHYEAASENVTVRKLLEADVNWDKTVNTQDATAIVDALFAANNG